MKFKIIFLTSILALHSSNAKPFLGFKSKLSEISKKLGLSANVDVSFNHHGGVLGSVNKHFGLGFNVGAHYEASGHGHRDANAESGYENDNKHKHGHEINGGLEWSSGHIHQSSSGHSQTGSHHQSSSHGHKLEVNGHSQHHGVVSGNFKFEKNHHGGIQVNHQHEHDSGNSRGHHKDINIQFGHKVEHSHEHKREHSHGHHKDINIQHGHKVDHSHQHKHKHSYDHSKHINIHLGHKVENSNGQQVHQPHSHGGNLNIQLGHQVDHSSSNNVKVPVNHGGSVPGGHEHSHGVFVNVHTNQVHNVVNKQELGHKIEHTHVSGNHGGSSSSNIGVSGKPEEGNHIIVKPSGNLGGFQNIHTNQVKDVVNKFEPGHKVEHSQSHGVNVNTQHGHQVHTTTEQPHSHKVDVSGSSGSSNIGVSGKPEEGNHIIIRPSGNLGGFQNIHTNQVKDVVNKLEPGYHVEHSQSHGVNVNVQQGHQVHITTEQPHSHKVDVSSSHGNSGSNHIGISGGHHSTPTTKRPHSHKLDVPSSHGSSSSNHIGISGGHHSTPTTKRPHSHKVDVSGSHGNSGSLNIAVSGSHEQNHGYVPSGTHVKDIVHKFEAGMSHHSTPTTKRPHSHKVDVSGSHGNSGSLNIAVSGSHEQNHGYVPSGNHVKDIVHKFEAGMSHHSTPATKRPHSHKLDVSSSHGSSSSNHIGISGSHQSTHSDGISLESDTRPNSNEHSHTLLHNPGAESIYRKGINIGGFIEKLNQIVIKFGQEKQSHLAEKVKTLVTHLKPHSSSVQNSAQHGHSGSLSIPVNGGHTDQGSVSIGGSHIKNIVSKLESKKPSKPAVNFNHHSSHSGGINFDIKKNVKHNSGISVASDVPKGVLSVSGILKHVKGSQSLEHNSGDSAQVTYWKQRNSPQRIKFQKDTVSLLGNRKKSIAKGGVAANGQLLPADWSYTKNLKSQQAGNDVVRLHAPQFKRKLQLFGHTLLNGGADVVKVAHPIGVPIKQGGEQQINVSGSKQTSGSLNIGLSSGHSHQAAGALNIIANGVKDAVSKLEKSGHIDVSANHQTTHSGGPDVSHNFGLSSNGQWQINVSGSNKQESSKVFFEKITHVYKKVEQSVANSGIAVHGAISVSGGHEHNHQSSANSGGQHVKDITAKFDNHQGSTNSKGQHVKDITAKFEHQSSDNSGGQHVKDITAKLEHQSSANSGGQQVKGITAKFEHQSSANSDGKHVKDMTAKFDHANLGGQHVKDMSVKFDHQSSVNSGGQHIKDMIAKFDKHQSSGSSGGQHVKDISAKFEGQKSGHLSVSGGHQSSQSGGIKIHHSSEHNVHGSTEHGGSSHAHVEVSGNHGGFVSGFFNKLHSVGKKLHDNVSNIGVGISLHGHGSGSNSHGSSHEHNGGLNFGAHSESSGDSHSHGSSHSVNKNIEFGIHHGSSHSDGHHSDEGYESGDSHSHGHGFNKNIEFGIHRGSSHSGGSHSKGGFGLNFGLHKQSSGHGLFGLNKHLLWNVSKSK
ncbi:hornerin isoform X6 [Nasonia vitripennis]|uniref:Uncharacterized protein n=1 Tax=Nasonia vitripennis TaxID=7425 RepID=A0A7M7PYQ4_NASVI|nr:hornerin isoform X6 [Nasonia vitripennis]